MISGHNSDKCFLDMKYNLEEEDVKKIVLAKKGMKSHADYLEKKNTVSFYNLMNGITVTPNKEELKEAKNLRYMHDHFEDIIIPSIYNNVSGYESQSSFYKDSKDPLTKDIAYKTETLSASAKYEEGSFLKKSISSLYKEFYEQYSVEEEEQNQQNGQGKSEKGEPSKEEIESEAEKISKMTVCEESPEDDTEADLPETKGLERLKGYNQFEAWLKSLKGVDTSKKMLKQITKTSDLQKVSASQLAMPRGLLMKKISNKELYCKQKVDSKRFMHIMTDRSGSMGDYHEWRNQFIIKAFEDCIKIGIDIETEFWNTKLHLEGTFSPQKIKTAKDLEEKTLSIRPDGGDDMGRCILQKLKLLKKQKSTQYILCISDGTGSISSYEQKDEIYEIAASKNIEFKFVLFSKNNDMHGTKQEDMFYVYE